MMFMCAYSFKELEALSVGRASLPKAAYLSHPAGAGEVAQQLQQWPGATALGPSAWVAQLCKSTMPRHGLRGRGRGGRGSSGGRAPGPVLRRPAGTASAGGARRGRVPYGSGHRNLSKKELKALQSPAGIRKETMRLSKAAALRARSEESSRGESSSRGDAHAPPGASPD